MLSSAEFIRYSLELNLFFARIAKEHAIFIEGSFTPRDAQLGQQADSLKVQFEALLADTLVLANGLISPDTAMSGELVTQYTLAAERASQFYTGIAINSGLTQAEISATTNPDFAPVPLPELVERVFGLNERAIALTSALVEFKASLLNAVLSCNVFTTNYPLLIEHILREARFYLFTLTKLQNRQQIDALSDLLDQEIFWNRIMAEHALFVRGLLDPTEHELITKANNFGNEFNILTQAAAAATETTMLLPQITERSLHAALRLRDFKSAATQGLIECHIRAIAYPLIADHILREANHYIRLLNSLGRK